MLGDGKPVIMNQPPNALQTYLTLLSQEVWDDAWCTCSRSPPWQFALLLSHPQAFDPEAHKLLRWIPQNQPEKKKKKKKKHEMLEPLDQKQQIASCEPFKYPVTVASNSCAGSFSSRSWLRRSRMPTDQRDGWIENVEKIHYLKQKLFLQRSSLTTRTGRLQTKINDGEEKLWAFPTGMDLFNAPLTLVPIAHGTLPPASSANHGHPRMNDTLQKSYIQHLHKCEMFIGQEHPKISFQTLSLLHLLHVLPCKIPCLLDRPWFPPASRPDLRSSGRSPRWSDRAPPEAVLIELRLVSSANKTVFGEVLAVDAEGRKNREMRHTIVI